MRDDARQWRGCGGLCGSEAEAGEPRLRCRVEEALPPMLRIALCFFFLVFCRDERSIQKLVEPLTALTPLVLSHRQAARIFDMDDIQVVESKPLLEIPVRILSSCATLHDYQPTICVYAHVRCMKHVY